jgi:multidrug resistance efflux pump
MDMKSSRICIFVVTILAALAIGLAIVSPKFFQKGKMMANMTAKMAAKMAAKERGIQSPPIAAKGVVESKEEIDIGSQIIGIITEIRVEEGDKVKKGQLLVVFDNHKIMARVKLAEAMLKEAIASLKELEAGSRWEDLEMAQSRVKRMETIYEKAKGEYGRQKKLYQRSVTALADFDKAEERMGVAAEELNEARANFKKLANGARKEEIERARAAVEKGSSELAYYQALLKDYTIFSPLDGLVAERYRDVSETVDVGTPLLKLIDPGKLRIRAELEETDVGRVVKEQPVEVSTDAYQGRIYRGEVYKVFPVLRRYSLRSFDPSASYDINAQDIYLSLHDFSGLKTGMLVTVRFLNRPRTARTSPQRKLSGRIPTVQKGR